MTALIIQRIELSQCYRSVIYPSAYFSTNLQHANVVSSIVIVYIFVSIVASISESRIDEIQSLNSPGDKKWYICLFIV